ncbi:MAG: SpoIIE family protein phosphatase [Treponema sp.]|jgi:sigma-B regulation protein RsbU (phosphoserine phosphatase)|nr:SpoIIE family protein phosphatase [Treponema sp.]
MAQSAQDIGRLFSPLQIGYIADCIEPINANTNVDWALEMISDRPDFEEIPVERNGTVLGVIPKDTLNRLAHSAWTRFWQKDLDAYIIRAQDVIDATTYINKVIDIALKEQHSEATWYIVQHRRSYLGIISLRRMLEYTSSMRTQDLRRASEIQNWLLDKSMVRDRRFDICLFNAMAHEIGGDFYRIYQADKDRYLVGCFDVAGKNISGAMTTMALGACFASFELFEYVGRAENMTNRINALIKEVNPPGIFVAAVLFYVDFAIKQIRVHNCGYSPVLTFVPQEGNKISYKVSNPNLPPLGIEDEYDLSDSLIIPITKGLRVCAYSDGLTDMKNIYGERYGEDQTTKLIKTLHVTPSGMIKHKLDEEIKGWIGTASLADDVTLVDMRFS